jgi:hypothetical protein
MDPPFTRTQLQSFNLTQMMRQSAIASTVKHLTKTVLHAASGLSSTNWTLEGYILTIPHEFALQQSWQLNPFQLTENAIKFDDVLPDAVEQLKGLFPDVEIRLEDSTIVVDWS